MIRAIRPAAVARDDASLITGWNIAPNVGYTVTLSVSASAVVIILSSADGSDLIGSGLALVGTDQPVTITPVSGQTVGMVDADLGWHLLVTTAGTEGDRTIRIGPAVDLPDEIHPVYTDDSMALARATAAINAGACYVDDVGVMCPLGLGAGIGAVASASVDGSSVTGQVESVTWTATPDGTSETAVIRRHTAIAPESYVPPAVPPALVDDAAETDAATATTGNVLTNDTGTLTVVAVNGLTSNVGQVIAGSNGGEFVINANGALTFDPSGDFASLSGSDTATTSVTYHASNGQAEASATLTVTVSAAVGVLWTPADISTELWLDAADSGSITLSAGKVSMWADTSGNARHVAQATASAQPVVTTAAQNGLDVIAFDGEDNLVTSANFPETGNAEFSVFWVHRKTVANSGSVLGWGDYNAAGLASGFWDDGGSVYTGWGFAGGTPYKVSSPGTDWNIWSYTKTPGSIATTSAIYKNGTNAATSGHSTVTPNIAATPLYVGSFAGAGRFVGSVAELIICPSVLSATDRQKIEGYLAHKWGLASSLPADHPYKSAPPTI